MNVHPYELFNTVLHNTRETIPFILYSVSLDPELVHVQMADTKQDIQEDTSYRLSSTPTPNTNLLDTNNDTIKYIKAFINPLHSCTEPLTNPISQFSSPTTQDHLTTYISA